MVYLEHVGVVGEGGELPERASHGNQERCEVALDGGDLGRTRAQVSGRER